MKRIYEHRDELLPERTLNVETNGEHVRLVCDAPGIASVSHVLTVEQWRALVAAVEA